MRRTVTLLAAIALLGGLVTGASPAIARSGDGAGGPGGLEVYVGQLSPAEVDSLAASGLDHEDVSRGRLRNGTMPVEIVMSEQLGAKLQARGLDLQVKRIHGEKASTLLAQEAVAGYDAFRSYSEPGGIRDELIATAAANPGLAKLVEIGHSVRGQVIYALKVTRGARTTRDGSRPAVLYASAQHAREWITPEMVRRLMHHYLDGYAADPQLRRLVDTRELWFVPVANPDGYDFTFTEGNRLWRKNLADNNGDGTITVGDGVDPNRNFPTKWGYDNEGSSVDPAGETYRGLSPASEPETRAMDGLLARIGFRFLVNYHSAAELLLYGVGWQVSTPSPDDVINEALLGNDTNPAVPGYDPDVSAELYTTNGETDGHADTYGTLAYTPEMSTCATASASNPDDSWLPEDCVSVFSFPQDEALIQAEFEKNIPFALSVAESAADPANPVSSVGLTAPDMVIDPFTVSYGTTQPVAVTAKRSLKNRRLHYSVNGRKSRIAAVREWAGGERYGDSNDTYFAEYRGTVRGTRPGDRVEVWFSGVATGPGAAGPVESERFTYTVADDIGGDVLVLAAEDSTGASPVQGLTSAAYAGSYVAALNGAGYSTDVYDVDTNARTAPHPLGVLSHYKAIVWESGDDIVTRAVGQPGGTAAKLSLDIELAVRDYLNEGGKLLRTGQYAGFAAAADGVYFYNPFAATQGECTVRDYPCLPLLNDFNQYWLGAYEYIDDGGTKADGTPFPLIGSSGSSGSFTGFAGTLNGPTSADNQGHTASFLTTSSFLPPATFPQFASQAPVDWLRDGAAPYDPFTGAWYLYSGRADQSYKRLTRTVDLSAAATGNLTFQTSYSTEQDWDYLTVEAHTLGQDDWTTLPDLNGNTTTSTGESCPADWVAGLHPFLAHYMDAACAPTGTTGAWNASTGASNGWQQWSVDLSAYAGKQVELSISYVSDFAVQGLGVFLDDLTVSADGGTVAQTSFEAGLDGWTETGPPPGSPPNSNNWSRSQQAFDEGATVTTEDTVYTGFGAEGLTTPEMRQDFVARSMAHLLGG